jgi:hypothetical protein
MARDHTIKGRLFLNHLFTTILITFTTVTLAAPTTFTETRDNNGQIMWRDNDSGQTMLMSSEDDINHEDNSDDMEDKHVDASSPKELLANMHGPLTITNLYDNDLGYIFDAKFNSGIINNTATAIELTGGPRNFRANLTFGLNMTENSMIKVTGERLDQKQEFDFITGDTREWVGQNAFGGAYQYYFSGRAFEAIELGGYYTHSGNKNLSDATYIEPITNIPYVEERRIAGARSSNGNASLLFHFWPNSHVTAGADYDKVNYDTKYTTADEDVEGLGGHIRLEQILTRQLRFDVKAEVREPYNQYGAELGWLVPTSSDKQLELGLTSNYVHGKTTGNDYFTNGISLSLLWGVPSDETQRPSYHTFHSVRKPNLASWVGTPAVRMPEVLAIADSGGLTVASGVGFCPVVGDVVHEGTDYHSADGSWTLAEAPFNPALDPKKFLYARIEADNTVYCHYRVGMLGDEISLANSDYSYVSPITNKYWGSGGPGVQQCYGNIAGDGTNSPTNPNNCPFQQNAPVSITALATATPQQIQQTSNKTNLHNNSSIMTRRLE